MRDDCGHYSHTVAKREGIVDRLSPTARHANFPTLYAKPMPFPRSTDAAREEIKALTKKNGELRDEIFRLQAEIDRLKAMHPSTGEAIVLPRLPLAKDILQIVSAVTGISVDILKGPTRSRPHAYARHLAVWLVREIRWDFSLPAIGRHFGGRDHTTIMHALKNVERLRGTSPFMGWLADPRIQDVLARKKGGAP